jgi:TM2 domain-containing membrane protein YozV
MESTIHTIRPRKRIIFIILGILMGYLGIHNLYIGCVNRGLIQMCITCFLWFTLIVPLVLWMYAIYEILEVREDFNGVPLE